MGGGQACTEIVLQEERSPVIFDTQMLGYTVLESRHPPALHCWHTTPSLPTHGKSYDLQTKPNWRLSSGMVDTVGCAHSVPFPTLPYCSSVDQQHPHTTERSDLTPTFQDGPKVIPFLPGVGSVDGPDVVNETWEKSFRGVSGKGFLLTMKWLEETMKIVVSGCDREQSQIPFSQLEEEANLEDYMERETERT